jgi:hypothetical protein
MNTSCPGVDYVITIFCDFCQFSAKKLAFFTNTNVMTKFFQNLALSWVKNANFFRKMFRRNYLKDRNICPGVVIMITIFCDFCQFSAKKLAFFSKTNVMIKILHNLALFWVKNANFFADFFRRKYFKNRNICPGLADFSLVQRTKMGKNYNIYWMAVKYTNIPWYYKIYQNWDFLVRKYTICTFLTYAFMLKAGNYKRT